VGRHSGFERRDRSPVVWRPRFGTDGADEDTWCVKGRCYGSNPTDSLLALHATVERHIAELADLFGREVLGGFTIFGGGQTFFRRELFDELGAFDEEILVEDIDMSARIHAAGKRLRVDPDVVTYEENPATLSAWWSQRTRWARGWMQVAVRYLPRLPFDSTLSRRARFDAAYTFVYALVPVITIVAAPMLLLDRTVLTGGTFLPTTGCCGVRSVSRPSSPRCSYSYATTATATATTRRNCSPPSRCGATCSVRASST